MEIKKIGQIQGRISMRRLVCNPTIWHIIINLCTKYVFSSLHGCGEIFDEKVLRNYGRMDGRTDGSTDGMTARCKPVYPPLFQSGVIITGGWLQLVCGRPALALSSALVPQTLTCSVCVEDSWLINALS